MIIPHSALSTDALRGVIEEFITREGTDYGNYQLNLQKAVEQVMVQLRSGEAVITFSEEDGNCSIISRSQL